MINTLNFCLNAIYNSKTSLVTPIFIVKCWIYSMLKYMVLPSWEKKFV